MGIWDAAGASEEILWADERSFQLVSVSTPTLWEDSHKL